MSCLIPIQTQGIRCKLLAWNREANWAGEAAGGDKAMKMKISKEATARFVIGSSARSLFDHVGFGGSYKTSDKPLKIIRMYQNRTDLKLFKVSIEEIK
jgi:hypothetical protein